MNSTTLSYTYQKIPYPSSALAVGTFFFGSILAAGPTEWPTHEKPNYRVESAEKSSYSLFSDQLVNNTAKQNPTVDFAREMAAIYTSLSQRQVRLGKEFEEAIFEDLESLYEA